MPLTFDWTDTDLSVDDDEDKVLAESAIWATMAVGINHITEANCLDFYKRVSMWEKVIGAYRFADSGKTSVYFTAEDIVRLIGLRTNASPKTKAQFYRSVWDAHERWNFPYGFAMPLDKAVAGSVD